MTEQNQTQEAVQLIDPSSTTVQDMFAKVLHQRIQSGALEAAIAKQVDSLISETAKNALESYSEVGKKVKQLLTDSILPQIDRIDNLPNYHEFVVNRMRAAAQQFYDTKLQEALDKELSEIFTEIPEKVTLSWVVAEIVKSVQQDDFNESRDFDLPMLIERDGSFIHIYIHDESDEPRAKHNYKYQLHLMADRKTGENELYSLKADDTKAGAKLSFGSVYRLEKVLFHLYALRGHIELDKGTNPDSYERYVEATREGYDD